MPDGPWWETTKLEDMTPSQWEMLCDGCGRCCLVKAWHGAEVRMSKVACQLLDITNARCRDYAHRQHRVSNCVKIDLDNIETPGLLPETCAYKRLKRGLGLEWWHPLVSGDLNTVRHAGISVTGKVKHTEDELNMLDLAILLAESIDDT